MFVGTEARSSTSRQIIKKFIGDSGWSRLKNMLRRLIRDNEIY